MPSLFSPFRVCASAFLAAVLLAFVAAGLSAQEFYEPFKGEVGEAPATGWENFGESKDMAMVESGSLEYPGLKKPEGNSLGIRVKDVVAAATSTVSPAIPGLNEGTVYYSFVLSVGSLGKMTPDGGHTGLIMLSDRGAGKAVGGRAQAAVGLVARSGEEYQLCISSAHQGTKQGAVLAETTCRIGEPVFVVVAFERGETSGVARLWVNPVPGGSEPGGAVTAEPDSQLSKNLDAILIGAQTSMVTMPEFFTIDEIRVGRTWEEVTPAK